MSRAVLTFSLMFAATLAGCGALQAPLVPKAEPTVPVPAAFPQAPVAASSVPQAADLPWQQFFAQPLLRQPIEAALQHNRDLRVAVLNIEAARALVDVRQADRLPTLQAGASAARQTSAANGKPVSTYSLGLQVPAYELDLFGRVRALTDTAAAQLLATQEARRAVQVALVGSVAQQALAVLAADELWRLAGQTLAAREESLKLTRLRVDNGASSDLDLRLTQTAVEAARIALIQAERQRQLERNALALLVGGPLPDWPATGTTLAATALPEVATGLPSTVLLARPDVRQAEFALQATEANISAARAAFLPRIALTGSLGTASLHLTDLFKNGAWSFAAQALQPLWDAGRNRANLAVAQAQRDVAVAQYERSIQAAFRDVADALAGRATWGEQLQAALAQQEAEGARLALVELRLRHGVSGALELLDAQRSHFAAQQAVVQVRQAWLANRVALYRALGGGEGPVAAVRN